jgi:hypothetical protein
MGSLEVTLHVSQVFEKCFFSCESSGRPLDISAAFPSSSSVSLELSPEDAAVAGDTTALLWLLDLPRDLTGLGPV